jgi:multisubunit Na+/H+ antiporter MnhG subunit
MVFMTIIAIVVITVVVLITNPFMRHAMKSGSYSDNSGFPLMAALERTPTS